MAKPTTLLQAAKATKPVRGGAKDWFASLTPAKRKEYEEWLKDWLATPEDSRISKKQAIVLITKHIKVITHHTLDKHINGDR